MHETLWSDSLYRETALLIIAFLFCVASLVFLMPGRSPKFITARASLRSWFFIAPLLLIFFSLPYPWTLVLMCLISIYATKVFFQMVGMFHRTWFVAVTYLYVILTSVCIYSEYHELFNLLPMMYFGTVVLIPLIRNSAKHMIQYLALSLMSYVSFGWCFLHLAKYLFLDKGIYIVLYIYILTEIAENSELFISRYFGKFKIFTQISSRWTIEGILGSLLITLLLAWGMRHLLPVTDTPYWVAAGLISCIFGFLGDLLMSVLRRDLGIKHTGVFIIGRGDLLDRLDKLIFVAPAFYHTFVHLGGWLK